MKYRSQLDELDPEYPAPDVAPVEDPDTPNDAYVIGERGNTERAPDAAAKPGADKDGPKQWVMPAAFVLSAAFVGLTVWNVSRAVSGPPPPPKPSPFQVKQALYLGVMRVDAYKRTHGGITPETLLDAGLSDTGGYSYVRIDPTRYVLSFRVEGPKLEYDSNDPKESFFGDKQQILSMGGAK